jgi:superfamily II DNA or RNA helicase
MLRLRFDRGTLVVSSRSRSFPKGVLDTFILDARDGNLRALAAALPEIEAACARYSTSVAIDDGLHDRIIPAVAPPPLRGYQSAAITAWEVAGRRGVVVLPTGAGKTRVAVAAITRVRRPTLCVVPTRVLLHQWVGVLQESGFGDIGRLGDGFKDVRDVTVATFESAYRAMPKFGNRFDFLVVDEVHHFGLGVRDELLAMSLARSRLGLTATPRAPEPSGGDSAMEGTPYVGPIVFELGLSDLVGDHLAPFDRIVLSVPLSDKERRRYVAAAQLFADARRTVMFSRPRCTYAELVATLQRSEPGRRALLAQASTRRIVAWCTSKRAVLGDLLVRHRKDRVLVFTSGAEVAHDIARAFLIHPITAEVGRAEREYVLSRFRSGEIRAIVSAQVLNEGLDVPDADVAVITGGLRGKREHVQRVGRVLRPTPGKRALIYELVCRDTHEVAQARARGSALVA